MVYIIHTGIGILIYISYNSFKYEYGFNHHGVG